MKISIESHVRTIDDAILYAVVRAIDKAVSEDVPNAIQELSLETKNCACFLRSDYINKNLRQLLTTHGCRLHAFKRYGWNGRLLIDQHSRLTFSFSSFGTLDQISRKQRRKPHYLQSLNHVENKSLHGHYEQCCLFDSDPFDEESYEADYQDIINGVISPETGYLHCVIAYRARMSELVEIKLVVLDPRFNVVIQESLIEYLKPNFAQLTVMTSADAKDLEEHNAATQRLTSLKPGIKPALRKPVEEEA